MYFNWQQITSPQVESPTVDGEQANTWVGVYPSADANSWQWGELRTGK